MTMELNRRTFLSGLIGGVAIVAAEKVFPFRVYSFPTDIRIVNKMPTDMGRYFIPPMSPGFKAFLDKGRKRDRELEASRWNYTPMLQGPSIANLRPNGRAVYKLNPSTGLYHRV